jgi:hypothetical protein
MNPPSAANRLRAGIEQLLTDLGVPKSGTTHTRIERLAASMPDVATVLEAVKWIGNDGSHTSVLPLKEVLEGVALLERALTLVYDRSAEELDQLARKINQTRRRQPTALPSAEQSSRMAGTSPSAEPRARDQADGPAFDTDGPRGH